MLAGTPPRAGSVSGHGRGARAIPGRLASAVRERCEMKGRLVAFVGIFCISMLIVFGADAKDNEGKGEGGGKGKGGGGRDGTKAECIVFANNENDQNDLEGDPHVYLEGGKDCAIEGCCPNAGPWPLYEMALHNVRYRPARGEEDEKVPLDDQPVIGHLFMNGFGRNAPYEGWLVQFWTCNYQARRPVGGDFFFQIRGGTGGLDRKTKVSVIEFLDANDATLWVYYNENTECDWNVCGPCENGMQPACDWENDPDSDCLYPCWIEQPLDNVSFFIVRTADLTYTSYGITCPDTPCSFSP